MDEAKIAQRLVSKMKRKAGTWALPKKDADILKITKAISHMVRGDKHDLDNKYPQDALYGVLGDDELFDALDKETTTYLKNCANVTKKFIKDLVKKSSEEDFKDPEYYEKLVELAGML